MRNQIAHIFRKDVRHLWREIVLSFAIIVAYAWHEVSRSRTQEDMISISFFVFQWLPMLVVVGWAFLVLRVVQAESLVGDRQFWVTRPYEWKKLLVAKFLFVVVFVNVPLLILQVFLLLTAGFRPTSYVPGLLVYQGVWVLILVWPVATLATITASIGQFMLGMFGALLYLFGFVSLTSYLPSAGSGKAGSLPQGLGFWVLMGVSLAVVFWQYAYRRTGRSRVVLLAAAATPLILMLVAPYRTLIAHFYPQATPGQQLPVQLAFDPAKPASLEGGYPEKNKVHIRIPLFASGVEDGSKIGVDGMMETIEATGGLQWNSGWHGPGLQFLANHPHAQVDITLDKDFFDKVKSSPANVHISLALAPSHARKTLRIVAQTGPFTVPGGGRCSFSPIASNETVCFLPPGSPLLLVSARSDEITCTPQGRETQLPAGTIGYEWHLGFDFGINPVQVETLRLSDWGDVKTRDVLGRVCPGTPLTIFTDWEDLQRTRNELQIDGIRLAEYQLKDSPAGEGGFGVLVR